MSGDEVDKLQPTAQSSNLEQFEANRSLFADAYTVGLASNPVQWIEENPGTAAAAALGVAAVLGVGYLTRGKWMPALSKLGAYTDDAARTTTRATGYDATKAGLTAFSDVANPALQPWRRALGYADVGLDDAGSLIYKGSRAGAFGADNVLVVNGAQEANTLFRAISREGLLQREVWERGASSGAARFGEVALPGPTKFITPEGVANLSANSRLIHLGGGRFNAMTSEAAEKTFEGLSLL